MLRERHSEDLYKITCSLKYHFAHSVFAITLYRIYWYLKNSRFLFYGDIFKPQSSARKLINKKFHFSRIFFINCINFQ